MGKRILELGPGNGGFHYEDDINNEYFALDLDVKDLKNIKWQFPNAKIIRGTAERIPFQNGSFQQVDIRFPYLSLLTPGIQQEHYLRSFMAYFGINVPAEGEDKTWYGEFSRVLDNSGKLLIWGDSNVNIDQVKASASPYFLFQRQRDLGIEELFRMRTRRSYELGQYLVDGRMSLVPVQMTFIKR